MTPSSKQDGHIASGPSSGADVSGWTEPGPFRPAGGPRGSCKRARRSGHRESTRTAQAGSRTPGLGRFIGRAEEFAASRTAIDAALGGKASLVMVTGEPGIGKTRLAEEGGEYARLRGAQVLAGRCYEGEAASPYSSFAEAIREYVSTRPDDALKAELARAHPISRNWSRKSASA